MGNLAIPHPRNIIYIKEKIRSDFET